LLISAIATALSHLIATLLLPSVAAVSSTTVTPKKDVCCFCRNAAAQALLPPSCAANVTAVHPMLLLLPLLPQLLLFD